MIFHFLTVKDPAFRELLGIFMRQLCFVEKKFDWMRGWWYVDKNRIFCRCAEKDKGGF